MTRDGDRPPSLWKNLGEMPVADCRVFKVIRRDLKDERTGHAGDFFVIKAPDWVQVIAATAPGEYLMVNQFRFGTEKLSWEFPAGCMEPGEDPVATAARELTEETGYAPVGEGRVLAKFFPNPALQVNTSWIVVFDKVVDTGHTHWDASEEIQIAKMPLAEIERMAIDGRITHGMVHTALYFLRGLRG
jgi:ADP-ribose pyrophosphatase